jgi:hypothetical protein
VEAGSRAALRAPRQADKKSRQENMPLDESGASWPPKSGGPEHSLNF